MTDEMNEDIKPNSEALYEVTSRLLNGFLKSLTSAPSTIWQISSTTYDQINSTSNFMKAGSKSVLKCLLLSLFAPAMEAPELFGIDLGKKKPKKSLQLIGEALRYIAMANDIEETKDAKFREFALKRFESFAELIDQWMSHSNIGPTPTFVPDPIVLENSLFFIYDKVYDKLEPLTNKLANSGTTLTVSFKMSDFFKNLVANPSNSTAAALRSKSTIF